MDVLKGAIVSAKIKEDIQTKLQQLNGIIPKLAIVRVGENPDDISYERGATKKMEAFGLQVESFVFPKEISNDDFQNAFRKINENEEINGILLLRPLPKQICEKEIEELIDPQKDLDGISPINIAKVFSGERDGFAPCTAEAVIEILKYNNIAIEGKSVTIIGRSMVVGKPLSMLLLKENATVTVCHTKTKNLADVCKKAEILVAAVGRAKVIGKEYIGKDTIVIDVGINVDEQGNLCGDVDFAEITEVAAMATPVPGGVGVVTTAILAKHLVESVERKGE